MMCPGDSDFCPHRGCTTCQGEGYYKKDPHNGAGRIDERDTEAWAKFIKNYRIRSTVFDFLNLPLTNQAAIMNEFDFEWDWNKTAHEQRLKFLGEIRETGRVEEFCTRILGR